MFGFEIGGGIKGPVRQAAGSDPQAEEEAGEEKVQKKDFLTNTASPGAVFRQLISSLLKLAVKL